MAIVNTKSDLIRDEITGGEVPDALKVKGVMRMATGLIANAAGDSNTSTYLLGHVPSNAYLHPDCEFQVSAWGFAAIRIGTATDIAGLVSALKTDAATQAPNAKFDANHGKPLWEQLGLASDPGGAIGIYAHAIADATGAGSMKFILAWVDNA